MFNAAEIAFLFIGGVVTGSYGSVVGGGALVSFPLLILLGLPVDVTIATNRFNAVFLEASSIHAFYKKKLIQWRYAVPLALASVPAALVGANIIVNVNTDSLNIVIAAVLFMLLFLLPRLKKITHNNDAPSRELKYPSKRFALMILSSVVLGVYGGFYGAGFGTFILFPFILIGGSSLLQASANARVVGFMMSAASSIFFIRQGLVEYSAAVPQIIGIIIGSQLGVRYAVKVQSEWIRYALTVVILLSIAKLVFEVL